MKSFFLDPFLVTLPPEHFDASQIEVWFSVLEAWLDELESTLFPWYHSTDCMLKLQQVEQFPSFQQLRRLVQKHRIDRNVALISKRLSMFVQGGDGVVSALRTKAVVYENCELEPVRIVERAPLTRQELEHDFLCVACDDELGSDFPRGLVYITAPVADSATALRVAGVVQDSEATDGFVAVQNKNVSTLISVAYSPQDLLRSVDCADWLLLGSPGFVKGVEVELQKSFSGELQYEFCLGQWFWLSVCESSIDTNLAAFGKAMRVAAAVVVDKVQEINSSDLRHLRTSTAADARQVERPVDKAKAWRVTITTKGVGWRLHYWIVPPVNQGERPTIEFANIVKKHDPERIPE